MSTVLPDFSDALADTVAAAAGGLVSVEGRDRLPVTGIVWAPRVSSLHLITYWSGTKTLIFGSKMESLQDQSFWTGTQTPTVLCFECPSGSQMCPTGPPANVRATMGIVAILGKSCRTLAGGLLDRYVQTDIVMYPGFSGGPLVDAQSLFGTWMIYSMVWMTSASENSVHFASSVVGGC